MDILEQIVQKIEQKQTFFWSLGLHNRYRVVVAGFNCLFIVKIQREKTIIKQPKYALPANQPARGLEAQNPQRRFTTIKYTWYQQRPRGGSNLILGGQILICCEFILLSSFLFLQNLGGQVHILPTHFRHL